MTITDSEFRAGEVLFETHCGDYDSKHIINLANREVPRETLDRIEHGCPIEALDEIGREFPICKYATQITIHGKFPELTTRRAGGRFGYVNLCRNQNGSVGVRWEAIDNAKKAKLFNTLAMVKRWEIVHNSSSYRMQTLKWLTSENKDAVLAEYKAEAERINQFKHLFFGKAGVTIVHTLLGHVAVLYICVNAYYERNYTALLEGLAGMTMTEIDAKVAEIKAEQERRHAEFEARMREHAEKAKAENAKIEEENAKWLADNPAPFPKAAAGYQLKAGDVICTVKYEHSYRDVKRIEGWKYAVISKSFGRLIATPCDANGVKERFVRGREFDGRSGDFYVKPTAQPAPVAVPSAPTASTSVAPSPACAGAGGVTVRENVAKGGIEIKFAVKPSAAVLANLKANGWRWTKFNGGLWYNRASDTSRAFAQAIVTQYAA